MKRLQFSHNLFFGSWSCPPTSITTRAAPATFLLIILYDDDEKEEKQEIDSLKKCSWMWVHVFEMMPSFSPDLYSRCFWSLEFPSMRTPCEHENKDAVQQAYPSVLGSEKAITPTQTCWEGYNKESKYKEHKFLLDSTWKTTHVSTSYDATTLHLQL